MIFLLLFTIRIEKQHKFLVHNPSQNWHRVPLRKKASKIDPLELDHPINYESLDRRVSRLNLADDSVLVNEVGHRLLDRGLPRLTRLAVDQPG